MASKVTAGLTKVSWNAVATGRVLVERASRWVQCPGYGHVAIPQFMDVDKQMEFTYYPLSSTRKNICTLHRQRYVSSFPELPIVQFFECLQYSKRGREGLVNFIT